MWVYVWVKIERGAVGQLKSEGHKRRMCERRDNSEEATQVGIERDRERERRVQVSSYLEYLCFVTRVIQK